MEQLEGIVEGTVGEHVKTPGSNKASGGPESRKKGFLGRQESRRQQMMDWAKGYYRKQSPYEDLGKHMLPTGQYLLVFRVQGLGTCSRLVSIFELFEWLGFWVWGGCCGNLSILEDLRKAHAHDWSVVILSRGACSVHDTCLTRH